MQPPFAATLGQNGYPGSGGQGPPGQGALVMHNPAAHGNHGADAALRGKVQGIPTGGFEPEPTHPEYFGGAENSGIFKKYDAQRVIAKLPYGYQYAVKERANGASRNIQVIDKRFCIQDKVATSQQAHVESKGFKDPDHADVHRKTLDQVRNELELLTQLTHPNLGRLTEYLEDNANFYLICEAAPGGDFENIMNAGVWLDEHVVAGVIRQVLAAANYCHQRQIVHRDIRPGCIFRTQADMASSIKIMEFGQAQLLKNLAAKFSMVTDPSFLAPEVVRGKMKYDPSCDIWSIGMTMYFLLCGALPFPIDPHKEARMTTTQMSKKLAGFRLEFPPELHWERRSRPARDLLRHLLVVDPKRRLTAAEAMHSEWISMYGTPPPLIANPYRPHYSMLSRLCLMLFSKLGKEGFEELYDCWEEIDTNKDNMITTDQLKHELLKRGKVTDPMDIEALVHAADVDNNETCHFQEFIAANLFEKVARMIPRTPNRLSPGAEGSTHLVRIAFDSFDKNHDGITTKAEMTKALDGPVMKHFEAKAQESVVADLLQGFPEKGDIDFQKFFDIVAHHSTHTTGRAPQRYGSAHHAVLEPCLHACGAPEEHHVEYHENTDDIHDVKPHHFCGFF